MKRKRILVAEDNQWARTILAKILVKADFEVGEAEDGKEALGLYLKYRKSPKAYSLVITDYGMPYMNGEELLRKIREYEKDIPFLVISGQTESEIQNKMVNYSNLEVMTKPIRKTQLLENVLNLLKYSNQLNELGEDELLKIDLASLYDTSQLKSTYDSIAQSINSEPELEIIRIDCSSLLDINTNQCRFLETVGRYSKAVQFGGKLEITNAQHDLEGLLRVLNLHKYYSFQ